MNNKGLLYLLILFLVIPFCVGAIEGKSTLPDDTAFICSDLKNTFMSENIKTRADLRSYFDVKSKELIDTVTSDAQGFIDQNFLILDQRMTALANKILIKACVGLIASLLFAFALWSLIKRAVRKVNNHKERVLNDGLQR